jgi:hypothetical protein
MKSIVSTLIALMLTLVFIVPAFAQQDTAVLSFTVTARGTIPEGDTFWALYGPSHEQFSAAQLTDPEGDGIYTASITVPAGTTLVISMERVRGEQGFTRPGYVSIGYFGKITVLQDMLFEGAVQGEMWEEVPQATPTATKTFQFTLYGNVPADTSFGVEYNRPPEGEALYFCGPKTGIVCTGNGTVYTQTATVPLGFNMEFRFFRGFSRDPSFEPIFEGTEVVSSNMTNTASYNFGGTGTGAPQQANTGNEQQMLAQLPDTGADGIAGSVAGAGALLMVIGYGVLIYAGRRGYRRLLKFDHQNR